MQALFGEVGRGWWLGAVLAILGTQAGAENAPGQAAFEWHCGICHGERGEGTDMGPALADPRYHRTQLSDNAIYDAIYLGVPARGGAFGAMTPLDHLEPQLAQSIVTHLRRLQTQQAQVAHNNNY